MAQVQIAAEGAALERLNDLLDGTDRDVLVLVREAAAAAGREKLARMEADEAQCRLAALEAAVAQLVRLERLRAGLTLDALDEPAPAFTEREDGVVLREGVAAG